MLMWPPYCCKRGASARAINLKGLRPADVAPALSATSEVLEVLGGADFIFRLPIFLSYDLAFSASDVSTLGILLSNIRPTVAPQFSFPVGLISPGFELGLKLATETIVGSGRDNILPLFQSYLHFITRFSIRADLLTVEITPSLGAFITVFNNDFLLTADVGVRVGINTNSVGSIILDINYILPEDTGVGGGSSLSGFSSIYSNALHISVGYAFEF